MKLNSANIDFKAGVYRSDEPVTVVMANGTTVSRGFGSGARQRPGTDLLGPCAIGVLARCARRCGARRNEGNESMKVFEARAGLAAALAIALIGASAHSRGAHCRRPTTPRRRANPPLAAVAGREFQGADFHRGGQARLFRQGAEGDLHRQRRRHSRRHEDDLFGDDHLSWRKRHAGAAQRRQGGRSGQGRRGAGAAPGAERATSSISTPPAPSPSCRKRRSPPATAASYDKAQNKVWLIGNVTLSDGGNVTKGDKLTYDLTTGQATVDTGPAAKRVKGLFIPGSSDSGGDDKTKAPK